MSQDDDLELNNKYRNNVQSAVSDDNDKNTKKGGCCSKTTGGVCCFLVLILLLLIGTLVGYTLMKILPIRKPQFSLISLERDYSSMNSMAFNAQIQIDNPNKIEINVDSVDTSIYHNSIEISKGHSNGTRIKSMDKTIIPIKLELIDTKTLMEACLKSVNIKLDTINEINIKILGMKQKITFKKDITQQCSSLLSKIQK